MNETSEQQPKEQPEAAIDCGAMEQLPEIGLPVRDYLAKRHYQPIDFVRRGSTSAVYKLLDQRCARFLAAKVMEHAKLSEHFRTRMLASEMTIVRAVQHPNIVNVEAVFELPGFSVIITEFADEGDLMCHVESASRPNIPLARRWFAQIARALAYLHAQGIAHRDIKVENVLLCSGTAKLTDFGYAIHCVDHVTGEVTMCNDSCGTLEYKAPETLSPGSYDPIVADCFSLGALLYVLVTHLFPFGCAEDTGGTNGTSSSSSSSTTASVEQQTILAKMRGKKWPQTGEVKQDARLQSLLCQLMNPDTRERITADQALVHPWTRLTV